MKSSKKMKADLIKKIKLHFGLNIYESKVWLALLTKNAASVGEIAELSGVPRSRVYDVLESLEKKGFAMVKLGKPIKYLAIKPSVVIEHIKDKIMKQAEEKIESLKKLKESKEYEELELLYNKGIKPVQPEQLSSAVEGRENVYTAIKNMVGEAKKDVILISPLQSLKKKARFLKPLFEKLKADGVNIKVAASGNEPKTEFIALSRELGLPIRRIKTDIRLCVVDRTKMLVFLTKDSEKDIAISINSSHFGKAITNFLMPIWKK